MITNAAAVRAIEQARAEALTAISVRLADIAIITTAPDEYPDLAEIDAVEHADLPAAVMAAIEPVLGELVTATARITADAAYLRGLEWAATTLQNHRHHADVPVARAKAWWATWNAIASVIDTHRCTACNDSGYLPWTGEGLQKPCTHPGVEHWAGEVDPHDDGPFIRAAQSLGYREADIHRVLF
jgi:hypothetical protein